MIARRDAIPPEHAAVAADIAAAHAVAAISPAPGQTIGLYAAFRSELATAPLAGALADAGATLAYPRVDRAARRLVFHAVADPRDLRPGVLGIPEPPPDAPAVDLTAVAAFVVPGLAFDRSGGRLGWGRGYYDATLAAAPRARRIGYAFELQLVEIVPVDDHDAPMDCVITEAGIRTVGE
ncbi:MAG: 5-formyltetrahydrofolate cyclo-ligase, partial [Deltaproteobacteria bacterium]